MPGGRDRPGPARLSRRHLGPWGKRLPLGNRPSAAGVRAGESSSARRTPPPSLSIAPYAPGRPVQTARHDCGDRSPKLRKCVMKNVMTPNITLAIVLVAAMAAVALRATARRPEPRWASGAESAPIALRTPSSPGRRPVPLSRCRIYFTSCTPMGAMLCARSATASTGWREDRSEPQPGPQILRAGPASTSAATDASTRPSTVSSRPLICPRRLPHRGPGRPGSRR